MTSERSDGQSADRYSSDRHSSDSHSSDSQLIQGVLAGEVSLDDLDVRARLMVNTDLDERLEENLKAQEALDLSGAFAREILNDDRDAPEDLPGADRVATTLQRLADQERPKPAISLFPRWAAAAAFLIAAVGIGLAMNPWGESPGESGSGTSGPTYLGGTPGTSMMVEGPHGIVESFGSFRPGSAYSADPDWRFVVQVHNADHVTSAPIAEGSFGFDSEWTPSTAELNGVQSIHWRVTLEDAVGSEVDRAEGQASLR